MSIDLNRISISDYDVKWGAYELGGVDKVTPDLQLSTKPKKVGSMGDVVLGEWIIGLEGTIKVEAREIDVAMYRKIIPWNGTNTAAIPLFVGGKPADLYDYAALLTLHPTNMGASTAGDIKLAKAVPRMPYPGERDGVNDDVNVIEFIFFPDRDEFPDLVYGSIG